MKPAIGIAVVVASAMLAPAAFAETVVPPGNSAATQYTEAFPTSGGNTKSNGGNSGASPTKVLGPRNAHKLESKGQVGEEVATLTAETAPVVAPAPAPHRSGHHHAAPHHKAKANGGSGSGNANAGGGGGSGSGTTTGTPVSASSGSSGFGEVLAQATGSSSGELGLFLPLIVIGTVLWSLNYVWRQRRRLG